MHFDEWYEKNCLQDSPGKGMYPTQNGDWISKEDCKEIWDSICTALSASIGAEAGEPVATLYDDGSYIWKPGKKPWKARYAGFQMGVYTAPPAASGQKLTDDEILDEYSKHVLVTYASGINVLSAMEPEGFVKAVRAILLASSATANDKDKT